MVEVYLVASARQYVTIVKLVPGAGSSLVLRGHVITFRHNGPEITSKTLHALPNLSAMSTIMVAFVGPKQEWEKHRKGALACREFKARPNVLKHFLALKRAIDPFYANLVISDVDTMHEELRCIPIRITDKIHLIDEEGAIRIENFAGADVSKIRELNLTSEPAREDTKLDDEDGEDTTILSYIHLSNSDQSTADEVTAKLLMIAQELSFHQTVPPRLLPAARAMSQSTSLTPTTSCLCASSRSSSSSDAGSPRRELCLNELFTSCSISGTASLPRNRGSSSHCSTSIRGTSTPAPWESLH